MNRRIFYPKSPTTLPKRQQSAGYGVCLYFGFSIKFYFSTTLKTTRQSAAIIRGQSCAFEGVNHEKTALYKEKCTVSQDDENDR